MHTFKCENHYKPPLYHGLEPTKNIRDASEKCHQWIADIIDIKRTTHKF